MTIQSNSQIFTNGVIGTGTDQTATQLVDKNVSAQETYLASSSFSNMSTKLPTLPSNQRVAKD